MIELSPFRLAQIAALSSALLLVAALGFQAAGYAPCSLCILQRWPHLVAALLGGVMLLVGWRRVLALAGCAAAAVATGLAVYHTGVELGWFAGPSACSGGVGDLAAMSTRDLMERLQRAPVVRCDEVPWSFIGISMAGWNALISAGLTVVWALSASGRGLRS